MDNYKTLNDTLEEELRRQLIDLKKENNDLRARVKMLEQSVATEQKGKYDAYRRISHLTKKDI